MWLYVEGWTSSGSSHHLLSRWITSSISLIALSSSFRAPPRLAMHRRRAKIKESVSKDSVVSRWIALLIAKSFRLFLIVNGPKRSKPQYVKGGTSVNRSTERSDNFCSPNLPRGDGWHTEITNFTSELALINQYAKFRSSFNEMFLPECLGLSWIQRVKTLDKLPFLSFLFLLTAWSWWSSNCFTSLVRYLSRTTLRESCSRFYVAAKKTPLRWHNCCCQLHRHKLQWCNSRFVHHQVGRNVTSRIFKSEK